MCVSMCVCGEEGCVCLCVCVCVIGASLWCYVLHRHKCLPFVS